MVTALVGGVLIDGKGGPPRRDTTLVIEGTKIVDVSQQRASAPEVRVVDLGGRTVMPGLIDCHIHFAHWGMNLIAYQEQSLMLLAAETVAALRTTLEAGCTTARDLGGLDAGFREAVAQGLIAGPRLHCSLVDRVADERHRRRRRPCRACRRRSCRGCRAGVQRPLRRARQGARGPAAGRRRHQDRHERRRQLRRSSIRSGPSSRPRRSRRSSTRPTWPASRSTATRSAAPAS